MLEEVTCFLNFLKDIVFSRDFWVEWQTLIGAFLGTFLSIIGSVFLYGFKKVCESFEQKREAHRQIEVALTNTLDNLFVLCLELELFVKEFSNLLDELQNDKNPQAYCVNEIVFPVFLKINFERDILKDQIKSSYLHNKILIIDTIVKLTNNAIDRIQINYARVFPKNEFFCNKMSPLDQKNSYREHLLGVFNMCVSLLEDTQSKNIPSLMTTKIYNNQIRKRYIGWLCFFWYEKVRVIFIKDSLEKVDKINSLFKEKTKKKIEKANQRIKLVKKN